MQKYAIGIVGGGVVGRFAAVALSRYFSTVLIEPNQPLPMEIVPHLRVSALTPASIQLLEKEQITAHLDSTRLGEILGMELSDEAEKLALRASEIGQIRLGYLVENEHLNTAIAAQLQDLEHSVIASRCEHVERMEGGWRLSLQNGSTVFVQLLVIAEGAGSLLRQKLGVNIDIMDYGQTAWVCHFETEQPHGHLAYQRFLPTGPLAFLPLYKPHWSSMVWTRPSYAPLSEAALLPALEDVFQDLGKLKCISKLGQFPLFEQKAHRYVGQGFALIGDAAHTVHPLAGQGLNLGLGDVAVLAKVLQDAKLARRDIASLTVLKKYAERVMLYNQSTSLGFSLLNRLYQDEHLGVKALRKLGWQALSRMQIAKKMLLQWAVTQRE